MSRSARAEVVIAGGGVAALEALIALAELAPGLTHVTLVAPGPDFLSPATSVGESFGLGRPARLELLQAAADHDVTYVADSVASVDPAARVLHCASGDALPYDSLILALGAHALPAYEHAEQVPSDAGDAMLHGILADLEEGYLKHVAFVVPGSVAWTLPLYELALLTASDAWSMGIDDARLALVTPEQRPLALFGPHASAAVGRLLDERGIEFVGSSRAQVRHGEVVLTPGGRRLRADRVFALPEHHGPALPGIPADAHGFVPTDQHGRVTGLADVFAVGDMTAFPIKQGGIAALQAEAVAQAVAARHGCALEPEPFRPVLYGRLMTGDGDLYLRHEIAGGGGDGAVGPAAEPSVPQKIHAPRLGRYLLGAHSPTAH